MYQEITNNPSTKSVLATRGGHTVAWTTPSESSNAVTQARSKTETEHPQNVTQKNTIIKSKTINNNKIK